MQMSNSLIELLEGALGHYNYTLAPNRIGFASLDFPYIIRAMFLLLVVWFIFRFLLSAFNRGK